jgi:O-antigen/teichoic acid export membrane protein
MFKSLAGTFLTRFSVAGLNFLLMLMTARMLGAAGTGAVNMLKANLALMVLIAGFSGVSALGYLASRYPVRYLYRAAMTGNICLSITAGILLQLYHPGIHSDFLLWFLPVLTFLLGTVQIHQALLLGSGRLGIQNTTGLLMVAVQCLLLWLYISPETLAPAEDFSFVLAGGYAVALLFSGIYLYGERASGKTANGIDSARACFSYGVKAQLSNLVHFFNYRLSLYFLEAHADVSDVGVYSLGVSLAESIWMISQSIAIVQFMRIARSDNPELLRMGTLHWAWVSLGLAALAGAVLLLIPPEGFALIFSKDFTTSSMVMRYLMPGILAQSFSTLLAHYFAGRGRYGVNLGGSFTGLLVNIAGGILLVPVMGWQGAAITASAAYVVILLWQLFFFFRNK